MYPSGINIVHVLILEKGPPKEPTGRDRFVVIHYRYGFQRTVCERSQAGSVFDESTRTMSKREEQSGSTQTSVLNQETEKNV